MLLMHCGARFAFCRSAPIQHGARFSRPSGSGRRRSFRLDSVCLDAVHLAPVCLDAVCLHDVCLDAVYLDAACLDALCLDSVCLDAVCLDVGFLGGLLGQC